MGSDIGPGSGSESALNTGQITEGQGADTSANPGAESSATTGQTAPKPSWKDVDLTQVDPHELIQAIPALQGVIGNMSQRQAQQLARQMAQDEQARQAAANEAARLKAARDEKRRLAQEDPDALAQVVTEEVTREEYQDWQREIRRSMQSEFQGYLAGEVQEVYNDPEVQEVMKAADRETLAKLDWRNHRGLSSWFRTVNALVSEHRAEKRATELSKARKQASDKESVVDAARDGAGDGIDLGLAGSVPGGRIFTRSDLETMSLEDYRKYKKVIAVQEREGRIK